MSNINLIEELADLRCELDSLKVSLNHEIKLRKETEIELLKSKEWQEALFYNNHSVILIIDFISGAIVDANAAACQYYGWSHTEICNKNIAQINTLTPEEIRYEMQLAKEEKRHHFYFKHLLSNGEIRDVEVFSGPIKFNNSSLLYSHILDITQLVRSEENLRQSSQKWEAIISTSADGIGMASLEGKIQLLSDKIAIMHGYSPEEKLSFIGCSFLDFIDPEFHSLLLSNLQKLIEGKEESKVNEYVAVRKDKSLFYVELNSSVLYDGNGNPESILYFQRDITERKMAQDALQESERKFKLIVQSQADGIGVVNQDEIFEFVNPAAAKIFETTTEQLTGTSLLEFLNQDEITKINTQTASRRDGITNDYELQIVTKAGNSKYINVSSSPKFDENKNYTGAYGIIRDISDRKLAQEALKEKSALLSNLIINMQVGILLEDSLRRIVLTNQLFCNMFSIPAPPEALVGADCSNSAEQSKALFKNPEQFLVQIQKILVDKIAVLNDELELADGRYFERDYIPTYLNNAYNGHLWKYRDITDRKLSQKKINQQNERLNAIITAMPDLILVLDQYGNSLEYYTNTPEKLLIAEEKVIGINIEALFDKETVRFHLQNITQCITQQKTVSYEYQASQVQIDKSGYFEARLVPLGSDNVLAFIRDVSEKKQKELEIRNLNATLENRIQERTSQLSDTNAILQTEISERKFASAATAEALDRLNKIADRVPGTVYQFQLNPDGSSCFPYASEGIHDIYRVSPRDVVNDASLVFSRIHPDDLENVVASIQNSARNLTLWRDEYRVKFDDGTVNWLFGNALPQLLSNGAVLWHGFITDITLRKKIEDALVASEHSYKTVLENIKEIIFQTDADGLWIFLNKSWEEITGFSVEESIGQLFVNYVHPDDRKRNMDLFLPLIMREKDYCRHQVRYLTKDGGFRWIEVFARLGLNENNQITGTYGTLQDITERKEAEDNLKHISYRLALAVQAGGVGVWEYDILNNKLVWDDQMFALYGIRKEEFSGAYEAWLAGVHPDDRERGNEEIRLAMNGEKDFNTEFKVQWPDGSIHNIKGLAVVNRDSEGTPFQIIGTNWDITAQKQTEQEIIKARNEAEQANLAKSEFLSRMSHELRTPMNSILGFAQLMELGNLIPAHQKGVKHILNSGRHLLNLINEVLDLSRIEAGMLSLSMEPVSLNSVIAEMIEMVQPIAKARQIEIIVDNSPAFNFYVKSDRQSLRQILLNLLNNAIKYNREGGTIWVKTTAMLPNDEGIILLRIAVQDTGYGIASDDISKLFKPFVRVGKGKISTEGTGLGLALVKKLMDAMSGIMGVESEIGKGSTFWIELPQTINQLDKIQQLSGLPKTEEPNETHIGTILYIEDNNSNIELIDQILLNQRKGIRLVTSTIGLNALQMAIEFDPDVILLDLNLPDIHGRDVIKILQNNLKTKSIPVVIISADAMKPQIDKLMIAGARNYLTKPLDIMEFLNVVDSFMVRNR